MEPDGDSTEERVTALESQVDDLNRRVRAGEQDARAVRLLAGATDRDVADLGAEVRSFRQEFRDFRRATTASFNALREDMNDRFNQVSDRFNQVDNGFVEMRAKLDAAAAGQQQIVTLLSGLIDERGPGAPSRA